jgi:hypothetical protein
MLAEPVKSIEPVVGATNFIESYPLATASGSVPVVHDSRSAFMVQSSAGPSILLDAATSARSIYRNHC